MTDLFTPLAFARGPAMKNRFMLAPLTNTQSHTDGQLSDAELHWLQMRAEGGFGLTMTCASHVQTMGQGFPGQLGIFSDEHLDGLTRLATTLRQAGSLSAVQLHHAGMRAPAELIGAQPVCPSDNAEFGARAMRPAEIEATIEAFIAAAQRADRAGFDGVELHGAHGYLLCQFLSAETNHRTDEYGGSLENRARPLLAIIKGIRQRCRPDFQLGLRLSPERFGMQLGETRDLASALMISGDLDFLDMSLWDVFKTPEDPAWQRRTLLAAVTELPRGNTRLGVAGRIRRPADARACLEAGADFVLLGRAAILHHDFPRRTQQEPDFEPVLPPVSPDYLASQGLSDAFIQYLRNWRHFVTE